MFTGLIEEVGRVQEIAEDHGQRRLTVACSRLARELKKGDSIAVSGVCLTAIEIAAGSFTADLAPETWMRTSFSGIGKGSLVNLEVDLIAKYVEKMLRGSAPGSITLERLVAEGF